LGTDLEEGLATAEAQARLGRYGPNRLPDPAAFVWALRSSGDVRRATTVGFLALGLGQLFHVFNSRFETGSAFSQQSLSNRAV
jgi:hypothetical protein